MKKKRLLKQKFFKQSWPTWHSVYYFPFKNFNPSFLITFLVNYLAPLQSFFVTCLLSLLLRYNTANCQYFQKIVSKVFPCTNLRLEKKLVDTQNLIVKMVFKIYFYMLAVRYCLDTWWLDFWDFLEILLSIQFSIFLDRCFLFESQIRNKTRC